MAFGVGRIKRRFGGKMASVCILCAQGIGAEPSETAQSIHYSCESCGQFFVSRGFWNSASVTIGKKYLSRLSIATREAHAMARILLLTEANWKETLDAYAAVGIGEKVDKALR